MTAPAWPWDAVAGVPVAVIGFDARGVIGMWNAGATDLLGWQRDEVLGRQVLETIIAPEDAPMAQRMTPPVLEGEPWEGRFPVVRRDGTKLLVSVITVPIQLGGGEVGLFNVVRDATTAFQDETERGRLLAAERAARHRAEEMADRLGRLQLLTEALGRSVTIADVLDAVVASALGSLRMASVSVCLVEGDDLVLAAEAGMDESTTAAYRRFPIDAALPASVAVRTGQATYFHSIEDRDAQYPVFRGVPTAHRAFAVLALEVEDRRLGAVSFGWEQERSFDEEDRAFLAAIADQAASAIDRARLAEGERRALERQAFLSSASRDLASTLDLDATLTRAAGLLVPVHASSSAVHLRHGDGIRLVAVANEEPEKQALMWQLADDGAPIVRAHVERVLSTNEVARWPDVASDVTDLSADAAGHGRALSALGVRSALYLPLRGRSGEVTGVLAVTRDGDREPIAANEVALFADVAERIGVAIANAMAHRERLEVARTLQQSLLPPRQPEIPGLDVAARYHPVGDGSDVGGDFYDVFRIDDEHWGIVMGDVSGKGVAAASLTALARYTVRAASTWELTPSAVLRTLNRAILDDSTSERFCTLCLAFVRVEADRAVLTLAVGGHPLPLLVGADGSSRPVGVTGTGIGLFAGPEINDVEIELARGDALVLYTDGMIEARSPDGAFAPDLMGDALHDGPWRSASSVADALDRAVLDFEGGTPRDDMAVLVVRMPSAAAPDGPEPFSVSLPAMATSATQARRRLAAWIERYGLHTADDMVMVVAELAANAARAARTGIGVRAWVDANELVLEVSDDGLGMPDFVPDAAVMPDVSAEQGRGLYLVRLLTDSATFITGSTGTVVRCTRRL